MKQQKSRIALFLPVELLARYDQLARRYHLSRADLMRLALDRELVSLGRFLERRRLMSDAVLDGGGPSDVPAGGSSVPAGDGGVVEVPPLQALTSYAAALLTRTPDVSVDLLKEMLRVHAPTVGVGLKELDAAVESVLTAVHPLYNQPE